MKTQARSPSRLSNGERRSSRLNSLLANELDARIARAAQVPFREAPRIFRGARRLLAGTGAARLEPTASVSRRLVAHDDARERVFPGGPPEQGDGVYTRVIVHELAHFCGPEVNSSDVIEDHSYRQRPNFFQLTPRQAIRTADCYSEFAGEAKLGVEPPRH